MEQEDSEIEEVVWSVLEVLASEVERQFDLPWFEDKAKFILHSSLIGGYLLDPNVNNIDNILSELEKSNNVELKVAVLRLLVMICDKTSFNPYYLHTETGMFDALLKLISSEEVDEKIVDLSCRLIRYLFDSTVERNSMDKIVKYFVNTKNNSLRLGILTLLSDLAFRCSPDKCFMFLGGRESGIHIPPIYDPCGSDGFSVYFWIYYDLLDKEKSYESGLPYVYSLRSANGCGYVCRLVRKCLSFTYLSENKLSSVDFCVQKELQPKKWSLIAVSHHKVRWGVNYVVCYIDGEECKRFEGNFDVFSRNSARTQLERCSIGCSRIDGEKGQLVGQLSYFTLLCAPMCKDTVMAIYKLGVHHSGNYRFLNEACHLLSKKEQNLLYNGTITSSILLSYNARFCDRTLILHTIPTSSNQMSHRSGFVTYEHAHMLEFTRVVCHNSVYRAIISCGGVKTILAFFHPEALKSTNTMTVSKSLYALSDLLSNSYALLDQMTEQQGFAYLGHSLGKLPIDVSADDSLLQPMLGFCRYCQNIVFASSPFLARKVIEAIVLDVLLEEAFLAKFENFALDSLFSFLINEIIESIKQFSRDGRITLFEIVNAMLFLNEGSYSQHRKGNNKLNRSTKQSITTLIKHLIVVNDAGSEEVDILSAYIDMTKVDEDVQKIGHLLDIVSSLISTYPSKMIPLFDRFDIHKRAVDLTSHKDVSICLKSLNILTAFLTHSTSIRKSEAMASDRLFEILAVTLSVHIERIDSILLISLMQLMTDAKEPEVLTQTKQGKSSKVILENQDVFSTICSILADSRVRDRQTLIHVFLHRVWNIIHNSVGNKKKLLRLPLWQVHLFRFIEIEGTLADQQHTPTAVKRQPPSNSTTPIRSTVFKIIQDLLYYAVRHEHDGWRVLIDTLSILHRQVSINADLKANGTFAIEESSFSESVGHETDESIRLPAFELSNYHLRIISDLLDNVEEELVSAISIPGELLMRLGKKTDETFSANLAHVICMLSEEVCEMCGGLMFLLYSAVSTKVKPKMSTKCKHQHDVFRLLYRIANLCDSIMILNPGLFSKVDQDLQMSQGTSLRQVLRLYMCVCAISAYNHCQYWNVGNDTKIPSEFFQSMGNVGDYSEVYSTGGVDPEDFLLDNLVKDLRNSQRKILFNDLLPDLMIIPSSIIQEKDYYRFRAITSKDTLDDITSASTVVMSLVYFFSVLICAEYQRLISYPNPSDADFSDGVFSRKLKKEFEEWSLAIRDTEREYTVAIQIANQMTQKPEISKTYSSRQFEVNIARSVVYVSSLLKKFLSDFSFVLQKGFESSGQRDVVEEALNLMEGNESLIPFVMFLSSLEWQMIVVQRRAGHVFYELVNESRIVRANTTQHLMKVAGEADFMLATSKNQLQTSLTKFKDFIRQMQIRSDCKLKAFSLKSSNADLFSIRMDYQLKSYLHQHKNMIEPGNWRLSMIEDKYRCRKLMVPYYNSSTLPKDEAEHSRLLLHRQLPSVDDIDGTGNLTQSQSTPSENTSIDSLRCSLLTPLFAVSGHVMFYSKHFKFVSQSFDFHKYLPFTEINRELIWSHDVVSGVFRRSHLLENDSVEIFLNSGTTLYFIFTSETASRKAINILPPVGLGAAFGLPQTRASSLLTPKEIFARSDVTDKWKRRDITNFQYLIFLNTISGRSYQDVCQYFIFPWVVADYNSSSLDIDSVATYRDLSKPIGALDTNRLEQFQKRSPKTHLYDVCYSNATSTIRYLSTLVPFNYLINDYLEGKSAQIISIAELWNENLTKMDTYYELTPEFFYCPALFEFTQLPPWANDPEDFVRKHKMALESELVSCQLHRWIDVVFGYLQQGILASQVNNTFNPAAACGCPTRLDQSTLQTLSESLRRIGRVPFQLLTDPHSPRASSMNLSPSTLYQPAVKSKCIVVKNESQSPLIVVSANNTHIVQSSPSTPKPLTNGSTGHIRGKQSNNRRRFILTISKKAEFTCNPYDVMFVNEDDQSQSTVSNSTAKISISYRLPIQPDFSTGSSKHPKRKWLGASLDPTLPVVCERFAISRDNNVVVSTGHWDKSFRLIHVNKSKLCQVVFGHFDVVTCAAFGPTHRSTVLATGSSDCTVLLWAFDEHRGLVIDRTYLQQDINPRPISTLSGHETAIGLIRIAKSAQGIVFSLSKPKHGNALILQHTIEGACIRSIVLPSKLTQSHILTDTQLTNQINLIVDVSSSGNDDLLLVQKNDMYLINVNGKLIYSNQLEEKYIATVACFDRSGQFVLIGCHSGNVIVCGSNGLKVIYVYPKCDSQITSIAVTENQRHVVVGLANGRLILLNVNFNAMFP